MCVRNRKLFALCALNENLDKCDWRNISTLFEGDGLLVAQAFDGIELRSAGSRYGAEDDPYNRRHDNSNDRRQPRNRNAIVGEKAYRIGDGEANDNAGNASAERYQNGFSQKLEADLPIGSANGFANSNFANARRHRGQHDVHDADAADDKGDH